MTPSLNSFDIKTLPKKKKNSIVKKEPIEYYDIIYNNNNYKEVIKYNVHKSDAYRLRNYFKNKDKYRICIVELVPKKFKK